VLYLYVQEKMKKIRERARKVNWNCSPSILLLEKCWCGSSVKKIWQLALYNLP